MGLFYFFGIGETNPAPFGLLKSPSGIPPAIMYKKCRAEWDILSEDNKKSAQTIRPRRSAILLKNGASRQK